MTLILETGTGLPNSNAYASLAQANAYWADRGLAAWDDTDDDDKVSALIRSTDYIDTAYVFLSVPLTDTQALENPRYGQGDALKPVLVKAAIELAAILINVPITTVAADKHTVVTKEDGMPGVAYTKSQFSEITNDPYPDITRRLKSIAAPRGATGSGGTVLLTK
jgi:hypothetical protein